MTGVWASDSSETQEFAFCVTNPSMAFKREMTTEESLVSSGLRELRAIINCVLKHQPQLHSQTPSLIYWMTDSTNVCCWLERGSRKDHIQQEIVQLVNLLSSLNLSIQTIHVPREHSLITLADQGSKYHDTDDWSIDDESFNVLQLLAGEKVTCDVFAYNTNARCDKFYSKIPSLGCSGINAFSIDWSNDFNFICPPVKDIGYVIEHIQNRPTRGILVIPSWPSGMFWNKITFDGSHLKPFFVKKHIFRPFLYKGQDCDNIFDGFPPFPFLGLIFDTSVMYHVGSLSNYCINNNCEECTI